MSENPFSEIAVLGNKDSFIIDGNFKDPLIGDTAMTFKD